MKHAELWKNRIERAGALLSQQPAFAPALHLYKATLEFQCDVALASTATFDSQMPLRMQIDSRFACSQMPAVLSVALKHGPEKLRVRAQALQNSGEPAWCHLFESVLDPKQNCENEIDDYFARACLQPIAEKLQSQMPPNMNSNNSRCPACGGLPQLAVLRPEGEGASRSLQCSFCLREWLFRRIVCPFCGEENKEKLPRYTAEQCEYVHVEGCDTCKHYLKAIDMSIDGRAVPLVDEVAWAVLDVWAGDHGYKKVIPNLIGF